VVLKSHLSVVAFGRFPHFGNESNAILVVEKSPCTFQIQCGREYRPVNNGEATNRFVAWRHTDDLTGNIPTKSMAYRPEDLSGQDRKRWPPEFLIRELLDAYHALVRARFDVAFLSLPRNIPILTTEVLTGHRLAPHDEKTEVDEHW
jgi:hypothetical protein